MKNCNRRRRGVFDFGEVVIFLLRMSVAILLEVGGDFREVDEFSALSRPESVSRRRCGWCRRAGGL